MLTFAGRHLFPLVTLLIFGCGGPTKGFRPPVGAAETRADGSASQSELSFAREAKTPAGVKPDQTGKATWYGGAFAGKKTASGERFDPTKLTAAHRSLPFGTWVEVRRVDTGRVVRVRINDRGPFGDERRVIDVSRRAAEDLDLVRDGVTNVELRVVQGP
ncbi:MAG: septal ring lytic transglycosylase RlpA family protein [Labilithrix sp.]|nr:septal ring lytic transglycosylase RlpA family protein [Labilithrix sp.]